MSVLVVLFLTAVLALFSGVYNQGKFARYIGILGLLVALCVSFSPELAFLINTNLCLILMRMRLYLPKFL